ncbi:MAG: helix-turn-helix domain-containing protein [Clostridia bacterium]|nr:helix-turn-helix domain-containing protein [Clostridia bacterium]
MRVTGISFYYYFDVDCDFIFEGHTHNTYEANIVLNGKLEVTVGDNVLKLSKGDMIFWSPDIHHNNRALEKVEFISIHFGLETGFFKDKQIVFHHFGHDGRKIIRLFMNEAQKNMHPRYGFVNITPVEDENGELKNDAAAIPLLESLIVMSVQDIQAPEVSDVFSAKVFRNALDVMSSNINSEISVPEIARRCGVCMTTLKKAFRIHAGKGAKKYYNDLRIEAAKKMLESGKNITETAFDLGFSSSSYFSQFFKNNTGINPKDYVER